MFGAPGTEVALLVANLPFSLRGAYPVLALLSGGIGTLVVLVLILTRASRRSGPR